MAEEREYRIGRHALILPPDHLLDEYQEDYRLYDRVLDAAIARHQNDEMGHARNVG